LTAVAGPGRPKRVLDIGCGTGMMMSALQPFGDVFGIDPDEQAVAYSRAKVTNPSRVHQGGLPDALPQGQSFEIVTLLDVLEHIEDDVGALRAMHTLLEPEGIVFVTVPAFMALWSGHDEMNQHKRRYTMRELTRKLEHAGFTILKCSYFNTLLFPAAVALKIYNRVRWRGAPRAHIGPEPTAWVNGMLRRVFAFERVLLPHINFPAGVSLLAIASPRVRPS
jgi:SAM-dependent methyltransferase